MSHWCITPPMYPHVLGHFLKTSVRYYVISRTVLTSCGSGLNGWGRDRGWYSCHTKLGYSLIISHLLTMVIPLPIIIDKASIELVIIYM